MDRNIKVKKTSFYGLFAILQKYDSSSKSQPAECKVKVQGRCLRYCKSTIFQANHNLLALNLLFFCLKGLADGNKFASLQCIRNDEGWGLKNPVPAKVAYQRPYFISFNIFSSAM